LNKKFQKHLFIKFFLSLLSVFLTTGHLFSQGLPIGQWRHHLPDNTIVSLAETPDEIIGANPYGLIIYNKTDNSRRRFNKVDGLSDFGITQIVYAAEKDFLIIAYENGNIDLKDNNTVYNIPDIKRASIIGSKRINNILIDNDTAFLATGFGIVKLNLSDFTIRDTYYIGPEGSQIQVNDLLIREGCIYAATVGGIFKAELDAPNLADYNYWERIKDLPDASGNYNYLTSFKNKIFANLTTSDNNHVSDTIYYYTDNQWKVFSPNTREYFQKNRQLKTSQGRLLVVTESFVDIFNEDLQQTDHIEDYYNGTPDPHDAIFDYEDFLWIGDDYHGMVKRTAEQSFEKRRMDGPLSSSSHALASSPGNIWVAPGSNAGWQNHWNYNGFFRFTDERWQNYNRFGYEEMEGVFDIVSASADPKNPNRVVMSSWFDGILIFDDQELTAKYNDENSPLKPRIEAFDRVWISSAVFDDRGNLWVANAMTEEPLSVKKTGGEWMSFNLDGLVSSSWLTGDMIIDDHNQKWLLLPNGNGIIVFREHSLDNNNDYEVVRLTTREGRGGLPSNDVTAIANDNNGYVWVATSNGVAVFYSPSRILSNEPVDAQPIILEEDGFAGLLFENETINSITVDGANQKWFGTARAGAFHMARDGRQTINHFDVNNSPIPSNTVSDIAVEPNTGEVFFATTKGLASFRGYATEGGKKHSDVKAYPNPVRPGYDGYIAINGLVRNANVKITDINGNLVYETIAEGGQAVWDGTNPRGNRPGSGVYLVFSTNEDGSETVVTKILFLN